jgi:ABC-2 type transport system permease protein
MAGTWAVARRELFSLWITPLAWVLLCAFLLMNGAAFVATLSSLLAFGSNGIDVGPLQAYYGQSIFVPLGYLLICPLLSMRTLAEERRSGTNELLLSAPIGSGAIVVGKYLALSLTYVGMWLPTLLYPTILRDTGHVEWSVVGTSYVGVVGLGLGLVSVGVLASALSTNQLLAAVFSGTFVFLLMLCGIGEQVYAEGPVRALLSHLSIQSLLTECSQGILSLRKLTYLATLIVLPLFLATRAVDRWREA